MQLKYTKSERSSQYKHVNPKSYTVYESIHHIGFAPKSKHILDADLFFGFTSFLQTYFSELLLANTNTIFNFNVSGAFAIVPVMMTPHLQTFCKALLHRGNTYENSHIFHLGGGMGDPA